MSETWFVERKGWEWINLDYKFLNECVEGLVIKVFNTVLIRNSGSIKWIILVSTPQKIIFHKVLLRNKIYILENC